MTQCPRCGGELYTKTHTKQQTGYLKKNYYFSQWEKCRNCSYVLFDEQFKVYPNSEKAKNFKLWEETKELDQEFLRKIS